MIAVNSAGKAKTKSLSFMIASSIRPLANAAKRPRTTPNASPMPTAMTPTRIEMREPARICEATSRPRLSVPNQWASEGGASLWGMSIAAGG